MTADGERRAARASWPVRIYPLGKEPLDRIDPEMSAQERMALVRQLTEQAWALAGREIPSYERAEMPVRLCKRATGRLKDLADVERLEGEEP